MVGVNGLISLYAIYCKLKLSQSSNIHKIHIFWCWWETYKNLIPIYENLIRYPGNLCMCMSNKALYFA